MDFFGVLTMLGGLALFLYGMETMGKGLEKLSGGRLERILEKLTIKSDQGGPFRSGSYGNRSSRHPQPPSWS